MRKPALMDPMKMFCIVQLFHGLEPRYNFQLPLRANAPSAHSDNASTTAAYWNNSAITMT